MAEKEGFVRSEKRDGIARDERHNSFAMAEKEGFVRSEKRDGIARDERHNFGIMNS